MKKFLLISFIGLFSLVLIARASWRPGEMKVKVTVHSVHQLWKLQQEKFIIDGIRPGFATLLVVPSEYEKLQHLGYEPEILIPDMEQYSQELLNSPDYAGYYDYPKALTLVDSLMSAFPNLIKKVNYGQSLLYRQLYAVKISDNVQTDEPEPEISFDGCHHGDEIMSSEVLVRLMRELCVKYGVDPQITELVNTREIWIYPFINPDGRMALTRYNNAGVDLNRDWGYMWDGWGGSTGPFSQPETQAARNWINDHQFVISQTNHGGTEAISYPWSYRPNQCPDHVPIDYLAGQYSSLSGYSYLPYFQGYNGMYAINGSAKDSFYGLMGSVGWTMEVSNDKTPPSSYIPQFYGWNRAPMLYLIESAGKGIKGIATDANNGNPVPAIIWVSDASKDYWPIYADPQVGDFHKYVRPGTYSVRVTANGYQPVTVNNVVVVDTGATPVNVQMQPQVGTFAYRVVYSQIPNNNYNDEGYTPAALGEPDNVNYSLGKNGYIALDMGETIYDFSGNDLRVVEGDASPEGYTVKVSTNWNGPWTLLGNGTGTQDFDLAGTGLGEFRYVLIEDDGDGLANTADAGFDLDAVVGRIIPPTGPFVMAVSYSVDDAATNNNGILEAGETAQIYLTLENLGVDPAQAVSAVIASNDPLLTVLSDSAYYGDLASGQQGQVGPYSIAVDASTPNNTRLSLQVNIAATGGYNWSHPILLLVKRGAKLHTNYNAINFPNTFVNFAADWPLKITNQGMDTLQISQFVTATAQFWVEETGATIPPGANQTVHVKFMPPDTLQYLDTLVIHSNDPVNFVYAIPLSGKGMLAPDIQVSPDSVVVQLQPVDSLVVPLTVANVGPGELIFTAQIGNYQNSEGAGGNDSFGHIWIDSDEPGGPQYDWIELANGLGTEIPVSGLNVISSSISVGFDVPFYNDTFDHLRVCNNGWISFTTYSISYNNTTLPSNLAPRAMIAPLWDNLNMQTDSKMFYLKETNRFIVEWQNMYTATGHGPYTFELIIHNNGNLLLQYNTLNGLEDSYTVGMQDAQASDGFYIAYNEPYLHDQMAILINRRSWVSLNPVGGTVAPGGQMTIDVTFKTDNFPLGDFWAAVEIYSNDPDEGTYIVPLHMTVDTVTAISGVNGNLPTSYRLEQNYPNPFNPTTTIPYQLPEQHRVQIVIYNVRGQKVRTLVSRTQSAGFHTAVWDGRNDLGNPVSSGIYFYRLKAGNYREVRRMLLMK